MPRPALVSVARAAALFAAFVPTLAVALPQESVPLPRVREGGTPFDPAQRMTPFAVDVAGAMLAPSSGVLASPAEYTPTRGVLFRYSTGAWPSVVRDCVAALTGDPAHDDIAYVVVSSTSQQNSAASSFAAAGADLSKVVFIQQPTNSIWMRDYGPHFVWQDGALTIADSHYYPNRPADNFIPTRVGDEDFGVPTYDMGLYFSGGNFMPGPGRSAFMSALVNLDNPSGAGWNSTSIADIYSRFQGIDVVHVLPQLPTTVDGTGHIDMWMYIVDPTNVIISRFKPGSNATAIQITDNAAIYMQNLGFTVHRPWAWNSGGVHYTYANAFRVNDRIFVPSYGSGNAAYLADDSFAISTWQTAAGPGVEIIPIDCYGIIPASGAIHCIVKQVPRRTEPVPAVHVVRPDGGQLLAAGETYEIEWAVTDTDNVPIPIVELSWSPDGGNQWLPIASVANTGSHAWTVPVVATDRARVRVRATGLGLGISEAQSAADFRIAPARRTLYDFSSGAGFDRWAWGSQTSSWNAVSGVRQAVSNPLSAANYAALATSNATAGDSDTGRYISPTPSSGFESTHVLEFTLQEDPARILDLEILVEGYAQNCTELELYVWDPLAGQWGDGRGNHGQNNYLDSWAGTRDGFIRANLRTDIPRYVGAGNRVTFLLYAERAGYRSFLDYVRLSVTEVPEPAQTLCAGDGSAAACPCGNFGTSGRGCANSATSEGASLLAFGTASVSSDDVWLACQGVPATASMLFFQGTAPVNGGAGVVFGDGLRCVGGAVRRLGVRIAAGGVAGYGPGTGDLPISISGALPVLGGTFYYQSWYRDTAGTCTPGTFNLTNALAIPWTP